MITVKTDFCRSKLFLAFLLALLAFSFASFAPAQAEKRLALVIGIDDYLEVPKLQKAVGDATAIADKLATVGFTVEKSFNPDRRKLNLALANLYKQIEPGDTVLIHYSGHGVEISGQNYLLPADIPAPESGQVDLLKAESLSLSTLVETLGEKGASVRILIIDACRDNPFAKSGKRSLGGTRGLGAVEPPKGTFIMFSAGSGQSALDRLNDADTSPTSVYTRVLLSRFDRPGMALRDLAASVREEVDKLSKSVGHEQRPAYYDDLPSNFAFLESGAKPDTGPAPGLDPEPRKDPDADARLAWESVKSLDSIAALEIVGRRYPTSLYGQLAMERAAELRKKSKPKPQAKPEPEPEPEFEAEADPEPTPKPKPKAEPKPKSVAKLRWVVVMGSFPKAQQGKARARLNEARSFGFDAMIIDTDDYSGLADGFYSVVVNAGTRAQALSMLPQAKEFRGDAYVKLSQ